MINEYFCIWITITNVLLQGEIPKTDDTSVEEMDRLCKYIYVRDNTDRLRTRAVLCHIYHMSLHDKWYEARDLMLMAHLQVCWKFWFSWTFHF